MDENKEISTAVNDGAIADASTVAATEDTTATPRKKSTAGAKKTATGEKKSTTGAKKTATGEKKSTAGAKKTDTGEKKSTAGAKKTATDEKKSTTGAKKTATGEKKSTAGTKKTATGEKKSTAKKTPAPTAKDGEAKQSAALYEGDSEPIQTALPIEELVYDSEEHTNARETAEETEKFESFFRDYKALMDGVMADAQSKLGCAEQLSVEEIPFPDKEEAPTEEAVPTEEVAFAEESPVEEVVPVEEIKAESADTESAESAESADDMSAEISAEDNADTTAEITPEAEMADDAVEIAEDAEPSSESGAEEDPTADTDEAEDESEQMTFTFEGEASEVEEESEPEEQRDLDKFDPKRPRIVDTVFEFVELFVFTLVAVMVLTTFFFRYSQVEGGSMDMTLADGDRLIISDFLYTPERGDIIVFEDYGTDLRDPLVKRIIGVAGDVVEVKIDGSVYVNGELLDEPYVYVTPGKSPTRIHGKWTVEDGELFVMGDHRDVSKDSREFGPIKVDSVLGEVKLRFYPFDSFGTP